MDGSGRILATGRITKEEVIIYPRCLLSAVSGRLLSELGRQAFMKPADSLDPKDDTLNLTVASRAAESPETALRRQSLRAHKTY